MVGSGVGANSGSGTSSVSGASSGAGDSSGASNNLRIWVPPELILDPEPVPDLVEPVPHPEPNLGSLFSAIDLRIPVLTKIF
jgi:hypothetical protein